MRTHDRTSRRPPDGRWRVQIGVLVCCKSVGAFRGAQRHRGESGWGLGAFSCVYDRNSHFDHRSRFWPALALLGVTGVNFSCFCSLTTDRPKYFHHFFDFKHHHSTHPDGPACCGCSGASKSIGKQQNPYENRRFCGSGGAGARVPGGGSPGK